MSQLQSSISAPSPDPRDLLAWYDRHRRTLPWRAPPGSPPDPYRVWLSEIMLQQTTVKTVAPYFDRFVALWPDITALAGASLDDILTAWQGLGYYARARNLLSCARAIVSDHGGIFPDSRDALERLPGIGTYTAAAIAAIAFDRRVAAIDANAVRVFARIYAVEEGMGPRLTALAASLVPAVRAGDFAQAVMDLGAAFCTPRQPRCGLCPWRESCAAHRLGRAEAFPARKAKPLREERYGVAFWLLRSDGALFLRRRPEAGLLGGMIEIPSTPWRREPWSLDEAKKEAPERVAWSPIPGRVRHGFTHFRLELAVLGGRTEEPRAGLWSPLVELGGHALPTLMKKIVRHVLAASA
jgi:A/G-specific adenine glycosylase